MSKTEQWLVAVGAALLVVPCIFLMGELTASPQPSRGRAAADARGGAGASSEADRSRTSVEADGTLAEARRLRPAGRPGDASRPGARASTGVYSFARAPGSSGYDGKVADSSYRNSDPQFGADGQGFDPRDLAVLDEIIRLNNLNEDSSSMDYDDGDGVLEPTELGNQVWCNGRLRVLQMGPSSFSSFGYSVSELPEMVRNLDFLVVLESNQTGLEVLPEALGELQDLERVSAFGNRLTQIPPELAGAGQLAEIQLTGNEISEVPEELQRKAGLKRLFVDGNPIRELPRMLVKQNEKTMRGKLAVPSRDIGAFGPDCRPVS